MHADRISLRDITEELGPATGHKANGCNHTFVHDPGFSATRNYYDDRLFPDVISMMREKVGPGGRYNAMTAAVILAVKYGIGRPELESTVRDLQAHFNTRPNCTHPVLDHEVQAALLCYTPDSYAVTRAETEKRLGFSMPNKFWTSKSNRLTGEENRIRVLEAYLELEQIHGCPPTHIELRKKTGISRETVGKHIKKLKEDGLIETPAKLAV